MCGTESNFGFSLVNLDGGYSSTESVLSFRTQVGKEEPPLERIVFCNIDQGILSLAELLPSFGLPHFMGICIAAGKVIGFGATSWTCTALEHVLVSVEYSCASFLRMVPGCTLQHVLSAR